MGRKSKADLRAERDQLSKEAEQAATELQRIARGLDAVLMTLPHFTSKGTRALLMQQMDRVQALADALAVEARGPELDPGTTRSLLKTRSIVLAVVLAVLTTVLTGAGEEAGATATRTVLAEIEHAVGAVSGGDRGERADDAESPSFPPNDNEHLGAAIREYREAFGLTRPELAKAIGSNPTGVGLWETGERIPSLKNVNKLTEFFRSRAFADLDRLPGVVGVGTGPDGHQILTRPGLRTGERQAITEAADRLSRVSGFPYFLVEEMSTA